MQPALAGTGAIAPPIQVLAKSPTGIQGLDQITNGGLPTGRSTLVCGPAGSGKTLLALEFIINGIVNHGEAGVFVSFEESVADLTANVASFGHDLAAFERAGTMVIDHVAVGGSAPAQVGEWDLEALFLRLGAAIDAVGARRVAIDTVEALFGILGGATKLRTELRRLFDWLKSRGVTCVITGERGDGSISRYGIEEYVSDCVIVLDHRVSDQSSTRRLRVLKYRGSMHGTNEYPFHIGSSGLSVVPITTAGLHHPVSTLRVSSGIDDLDSMLGGSGFFAGSTVLVSGTAGTGKSSVAAQFCDAACRRGERSMYIAFEESEPQIVRNMRSIGIDLQPWVDAGLLRFRCFRPSLVGLEAHLHAIQDDVDGFRPSVLVKDPVSDLLSIASSAEVGAMLSRQVDFLKGRGVTTLFTSLTSERVPPGASLAIEALIDTWLVLGMTVRDGRHTREISVLKSRGMVHTDEIRELFLASDGIHTSPESGSELMAMRGR